MKLTVDFSALHRAVAPLGNVEVNFEITSSLTELESIGADLITGIIGVDFVLPPAHTVNEGQWVTVSIHRTPIPPYFCACCPLIF